MTARDIISPVTVAEKLAGSYPVVEATLPMVEVIPRLLDSPGRRLGVVDHGELIGLIDMESALGGVARIFPAREDCSLIELECVPADYSASLLTHAAEDADVHVVGLWTNPSEDGKRVRVTMRLRCDDPIHVVRNLERYGFEVVETYARADAALEMAARRFEELQLYLNI